MASETPSPDRRPGTRKTVIVLALLALVIYVGYIAMSVTSR